MIYVDMTFDAGHRIVGHKGKCARLHGHTYRCEITMNRKELRDPGFVVDFGDVKDLVNEWDHHLLLWEQEDEVMQDLPGGYGVIYLAFNPTAECMAYDLAHRICFSFDLDYCKVRLWETPKAYAEVEVTVHDPD